MEREAPSASIRAWFPELSEEAWERLDQCCALLAEWNQAVNLVSRKDIERLASKHLAHCLAITPHLHLMRGARVLDVGTGGGLPGLPMAICYPQAHFLLVDSVGKKIRVVSDIAQRLGLKNVEARQIRAETLKKEFDFVTGRAVTALPRFVGWVGGLVRRGRKHSLENGILYWKGGPYADELTELRLRPKHVFDLQTELGSPEFAEKYILHLLPRGRG